MSAFARRHPIWTAIFVIVAAVLLWMIFALWPPWLIDLIGKKKVFLNALFNGVTLGGLYFLVASGFTLIFGLMRNVKPHIALPLLRRRNTTGLPSSGHPDKGKCSCIQTLPDEVGGTASFVFNRHFKLELFLPKQLLPEQNTDKQTHHQKQQAQQQRISMIVRKNHAIGPVYYCKINENYFCHHNY